MHALSNRTATLFFIFAATLFAGFAGFTTALPQAQAQSPEKGTLQQPPIEIEIGKTVEYRIKLENPESLKEIDLFIGGTRQEWSQFDREDPLVYDSRTHELIIPVSIESRFVKDVQEGVTIKLQNSEGLETVLRSGIELPSVTVKASEDKLPPVVKITDIKIQGDGLAEFTVEITEKNFVMATLGFKGTRIGAGELTCAQDPINADIQKCSITVDLRKTAIPVIYQGGRIRAYDQAHHATEVSFDEPDSKIENFPNSVIQGELKRIRLESKPSSEPENTSEPKNTNESENASPEISSTFTAEMNTDWLDSPDLKVEALLINTEQRKIMMNISGKDANTEWDDLVLNVYLKSLSNPQYRFEVEHAEMDGIPSTNEFFYKLPKAATFTDLVLSVDVAHAFTETVIMTKVFTATDVPDLKKIRQKSQLVEIGKVTTRSVQKN